MQNEPVSTPVPSDAPQIVVGSKTTMAGNTVTVDVSLKNNPGIISMMLHLSYDDALTLINIGDTGLFPGRVHGDVTDVLFWDYGTSSQNFTGNGVIATLTFTLSEEAEPGEYHICLSYDNAEGDIINIDFEPVEFAVQNGAVTVAAAQPEMHTVTFKDWDGTVLKTQEVQNGGDAEAPADPTRVGYTFTGWDKAFTTIKADLVVTAQYEMLGDVDGDGNVSMADALTILRMAMDILPVENQQIADVDGDGFITSMDALLALRFAMHIEQ